MNAAHVLLEGLIDYAGLFPPASLDMRSAVKAYAEYKSGDDRKFLGRFILPASRLGEFANAAAPFLETSENPWRLSVTVPGNPAQARDAIVEFNRYMAAGDEIPHVQCDAVEIPVRTSDEIEVALATFPETLELFVEIPVQTDPTAAISRLSGTRARAKIRTGGVVESAFPSSQQIIRFMRACFDNQVPFKATAGLHHSLRGSYPLTYESDAPRGTMYGYLNIFLAAAFLEAGMDDADLIQLLEETNPKALILDDDCVRWRSFAIPTSELSDTRRLFAISFGSCSFVEPVSEARELNLI